MEAAFKPEVNGELDTQNFEKFEEVFLATIPLELPNFSYPQTVAVSLIRYSVGC